MLDKQVPLDPYIPIFFLMKMELDHTTRDILESSEPTIPIHQKRPAQVLRQPLSFLSSCIYGLRHWFERLKFQPEVGSSQSLVLIGQRVPLLHRILKNESMS